MNRRHALALLSATALPSFAAEVKGRLGSQVATNSYPWLTFAKRAGEKFVAHSEELIASIAATGITGYEPIVGGPGEFAEMAPHLKKHRLWLKSIYVNSTLHEEGAIEKSQTKVLEIARAGKALGLKIVVTNPSPIKWGGKEEKSDAQLKRQAGALDELGEALADEGMQPAYHNHDAELKSGAREFHHILTATSPEKVKFCLDAHWIFRGCGNSEVAVFDALSHYHERVVELHLRQSTGGGSGRRLLRWRVISITSASFPIWNRRELSRILFWNRRWRVARRRRWMPSKPIPRAERGFLKAKMPLV
ncbi:TIM barrel protein [Akkermansiaceae bacterium]|nr:TIM barrel protein [Akkermansiaceae bacterium]